MYIYGRALLKAPLSNITPCPQQAPPYGRPTTPGQNPPHNYPPPGAPQRQINFGGYSPNPTTSDAPPLPPQPNYNSYPVNGSQAHFPLPSGLNPQQQQQQQQFSSLFPYGLHQPIPVLGPVHHSNDVLGNDIDVPRLRGETSTRFSRRLLVLCVIDRWLRCQASPAPDTRFPLSVFCVSLKW